VGVGGPGDSGSRRTARRPGGQPCARAVPGRPGGRATPGPSRRASRGGRPAEGAPAAHGPPGPPGRPWRLGRRAPAGASRRRGGWRAVAGGGKAEASPQGMIGGGAGEPGRTGPGRAGPGRAGGPGCGVVERAAAAARPARPPRSFGLGGAWMSPPSAEKGGLRLAPLPRGVVSGWPLCRGGWSQAGPSAEGGGLRLASPPVSRGRGGGGRWLGMRDEGRGGQGRGPSKGRCLPRRSHPQRRRLLSAVGPPQSARTLLDGLGHAPGIRAHPRR
jgi:hypothetical protein